MEVVALDETDEAYVASIALGGQVAFHSGGRIAVADLGAGRILVYDRSGSLLGTFGRDGDGPGEFRDAIWAVAWDSRDRLWVADSRRITVLDENLALDTLFSTEADYVRLMEPAGGRMVMAEHRFPIAGPALRIYELDGRTGPTLMEVPERDQAPYVMGEFWAIAAAAGDTIFAASSLSYPLRIHAPDGALLDTFGTRPPSIGTMTYPARGAFVGARAWEGMEWLRTFGSVRSMWVVHDSLVVVEHQRRHPEAGGIPPFHYWIDVYHRWSLEKLAEDIPLPGFALDVHDDLLWLLTGTPLTSDPPGGPWTLTGHRLVLRGADRPEG